MPAQNSFCYNLRVGQGGYNFDLRDLPSVSSLLDDKALGKLAAELGLTGADIKRSAEAVLNIFRGDRVEDGEPLSEAALRELVVDAIAGSLRHMALRKLQPVINATGIIVHTNLGRAPLGKRLLDAVRPALAGYSNLEYELEAGKRGKRGGEIERLLCALSGAEGALLVNNNAGAVFLILHTLCAGREVVISRGELIQIGGGFRIPEILAESGAILREVGTTNQTFLADYERALNENTAAIMKAHQSNFEMVGFVASAGASELIPLVRANDVLLIEDIGAATLLPEAEANKLNLPHPAPSLRAGADLVCFSADKVLGLTQGGIILGRRELTERLRASPLYRVLRPDKSLLSVIEAGLSYLTAGDAEAIPVNALLKAELPELKNRAFSLARKLRKKGMEAEVVESEGEVGGGVAGRKLASYAVAVNIEGTSPGELAQALRQNRPAVLAIVREDRLLLDFRAVLPEQDDALVAAVLAATQAQKA